MSVSYSHFINHLHLFKTQPHFENVVVIELYKPFKTLYKEIIDEDLKKPIFSQTTKFKKFPNQQSNIKNYKYLKINRENENNAKKVWTLQTPVGEEQKILLCMNTFFNKLSADTFDTVSDEFVEQLSSFQHPKLFQYVSEQIYEKSMFETKFRHLYIKFLVKCWNSKKIHTQTYPIQFVEDEEKYYWSDNQEKTYGPYDTLENAEKDVLSICSFKKFFIQFIQKKFNEKDLSFVHQEDISDDDFFQKKKKFFLVGEFVFLLIKQKIISYDILHFMMIDLLHLNNNFNPIEEIEFEMIYIILKSFVENKTSFDNLSSQTFIFSEYTKLLNSFIENKQLSKRMIFFINDILQMIGQLFNKKQEKTDEQKKEQITPFLDSLKQKSSSHSKTLFLQLSIDEKKEAFYQMLFYVLENTLTIQSFETTSSFCDKQFVFEMVEKLIGEIEDIMLDIPDAPKKMSQILNKMEHVKKNQLISKLQSILLENDSDSDDDF